MRRRVLVAVLALVVLSIGFVVVRGLWNTASTHFPEEDCTAGGYTIDTSQAAVAATMVGAVTSYTPALPDRAAVLVLAAGLQESKLRNLAPGQGDRDSVGVLQQRPSQGWGGGDPVKLQNVFFATTEFLKHLVKIDGWQQLPLAEAVQDVQISADGSAYAPHEPEATALATALLGRQPAGITCTFPKPTTVAATSDVATRVAADLPINKPTASAATITVPGAHWQTASWFVAYADRLGIDSVSYDAQTWTRTKGWKSSTAPTTAVTATLAPTPR